MLVDEGLLHGKFHAATILSPESIPLLPMTSPFIPEHEIYGLLSGVGIKTPRYCFVDDASKFADAPFASGEPVVVKGIARDLWHKSEHGALAFCDFDVDAVSAMHGSMSVRVGAQFDWLGTLIAEKVEVQSA